jgi:hypothetical protein
MISGWFLCRDGNPNISNRRNAASASVFIRLLSLAIFFGSL